MDNRKILVPLYDEKLIDENSNIELAEIKIYGRNIVSPQSRIYLKMSKEAMVGCATYAIRIANTTETTDKFHIQVDPLGNPCGNQPLGFFLTNDSPSFVLMYNQFDKTDFKDAVNYKEFNKKYKFKLVYEVPIEVADNVIEPFEIGWQNVAAIKVIDKSGNDITEQCIYVALSINRKGLFEFGKALLKIAHNYEEGDEYSVGHIANISDIYNFGVILTEMSSSITIQCVNCGNVLKYETDFGCI